MKSGKKIYRQVLLVSDRPEVANQQVRDLGNGSLRSLILHATKLPDDSQVREQVLAMAMCEACRRFLNQGRKVL